MQSTEWASELSYALGERFPDSVIERATYRGQTFARVRAHALTDILRWLKIERGFDSIVDATVVDYPKREAGRFDLIYVVYSHRLNERVRITTTLAEGERPQSAVPVYEGANWLEREIYDMFGIEFAGHPDLRRILLPDGWRGFPLRKDASILAMDQQWVQENLGIESGQ